MKRDYKIYYNDSYILMTSDRSQINKNFAKVFSNEKETREFFSNPAPLFDGITNVNILALSDKPGDIMSLLMEHLEIVVAGGGIVWNEDNELLMIYRRGKWDLPKGKIEIRENIIDGAIREVEEETGVRIDEVVKTPVHTYHTYQLKGRNCLKETSWYEMKARPNHKNLAPQTEEDIEEARCVNRSDLKNYRKNSYLLIWDLIQPFSK